MFFNMWSKHFRYVASVMLITLLVALAIAAIALIYILLIEPEPFFITFSNLLFLAAMAVLTIGAFFEFFMRDLSAKLGMILLTLIESSFKGTALKDVGKEKADQSEYGPSGGWMLIYAGILAIIISLLSAFIGMK